MNRRAYLSADERDRLRRFDLMLFLWIVLPLFAFLAGYFTGGTR